MLTEGESSEISAAMASEAIARYHHRRGFDLVGRALPG